MNLMQDTIARQEAVLGSLTILTLATFVAVVLIGAVGLTGCMDDSPQPTDGGCEIDATMHSTPQAGNGLCAVSVFATDATGLAMTVSLTDSRGFVVASQVIEPGADALFPAVTCDIFLATATPNGTGPSCKLNVVLE